MRGCMSTPSPQSHDDAIPCAGFCVGNSCAVTPVTFKFLCLLVVTHRHIYQVRLSLAVPHAAASLHSCPCFAPSWVWAARAEAVAFEIIRTKVLTLLRQWKDKLPSF